MLAIEQRMEMDSFVSPLCVTQKMMMIRILDKGRDGGKCGLTENLGDVGIVHVGTVFQDLPTFVLCPDHEGIHGSLNMG